MQGTRIPKTMEHALKPIRYQSEKHKKLTTLINRINATSLWGTFLELQVLRGLTI